MILNEAHGVKADDEFAQNVSHTSIGVAPSEVGDPFSINRCVDQRRAPKHSCYGGMLVAEGLHGIMPHEAQTGARER